MNEASKPLEQGLSRRSLLRGGGALAATAGAAAALAGCENTTTPVAGSGGKAILGDPAVPSAPVAAEQVPAK